MNTKIHETAIISAKAKLGNNVRVGAYSIIGDNVVLGNDCTVESFCEIGVSSGVDKSGRPLVISDNSIIRSHSVFYTGSEFGKGLVTGHRVTVREMVSAGNGLQIGTLCDIQGHCSIGNYVKFHSNVHIGQQSIIDDYVWIFPYVVLTNDPHPPSTVLEGIRVRNFAVIATMTVVLPGVDIGEGALIGAHSSVSKNVEADCVYIGSPAKKLFSTEKIKHRDSSIGSAYPWRKHFHRGYPEDVVQEWIKEFSEKE